MNFAVNQQVIGFLQQISNLWTRATTSKPFTIKDEEALIAYGVHSSGSGIRITPETSLTFSAVYACVALISNSIATVPWGTYERRQGEKVLATDHPVYKLLKHEPHPHYSSTSFRKSLIASALLTGNGYARIERDPVNLQPVALHLRKSSEIMPYMDEDDNLWYYDYKVGGAVPYMDMIHIAALGFDGIKGKSPITLAREAIGFSLAAAQTGAKFWANGAHLSGYVSVPGVLDDSGQKRLANSWKEAYSGPDKAGRTAFLFAGAEYKKFEMNMSDAQYLESRKFQIEEIARMFSMPMSKLLGQENSSYSSREHSSIEFVEDCLRPWVVAIEQEVDRKLFIYDQRDYYTKLNLAGLLRGDMNARRDYYAKMLEYGVLSINEVRALDDQNPVEGGDQRFVQINRIPLDKAQAYADGVINPTANA